MRTIYHLRRTEGNFTVLRIMNVAGISRKDISPRTVRQFLNAKRADHENKEGKNEDP